MINIINVFVIPFLFALIGSSLFIAIPLLIVSAIYPIIILGFILTHEIFAMYFLCALLGITLSMFWPTYETHISVNLDQYRATKNLQGFNLGWSTGSVLGCALGGEGRRGGLII